MVILFVELEKYSETDLAISNIIQSISGVLYMFAASVGLATSAIIGNLVGMNEDGEIKEIIFRIVKTFYAMMISTLPELPAFVYFYAMYGIGKTKIAFVFDFIGTLCFGFIIFMLTRILHLGISYCWTVEFVYYSIWFLLSYRYLRKSKYYKLARH